MTKTPGIRIKGNRYEVSVRVRGELRARTFPLSTPLGIMQGWRESERGEAPVVTDEAPAPSAPPASADVPDAELPKGTLGRDAHEYLATVQHTPDHVNKVVYLKHWVTVLGRLRRRATIESIEIGKELSKLLDTYAPTTVRHYRTALAAVWTANDGKNKPNPVRDTKRPVDRPAEPRAVALAVVQKVLAAMRPSKTKWRLLLLLTTGLPHAQIRQILPTHWNREAQTLFVTRRKKGGGTKSRTITLSPAAAAVMIQFDRWDCYGHFSGSAMHSLLARECKKAGVPVFRPYDLRHTQGALIYAATGDLDTVARMLDNSPAMARRYAADAFVTVDAGAAARVGATLQNALGELLGGAL